MKRFFLHLSLVCILISPAFVQASPENTQPPESVHSNVKDDGSVGSESGKEGGIYAVGRGFKTAGDEMEKGFKAAGKGIVKGSKATGRAFKKAGGAVKDFFTGEKSDEEEVKDK